MSGLLFVDTSAWFALVNRRDPDHRSVSKVLESSAGRLVSSNFVFDETITLCRYRLGHGTAVRVGKWLRGDGTAELVRATANDEAAGWDLFRERSDKDYSFTDCVSFVMMRRLGIEHAAACDDDFRREGFIVLP